MDECSDASLAVSLTLNKGLVLDESDQLLWKKRNFASLQDDSHALRTMRASPACYLKVVGTNTSIRSEVAFNTRETAIVDNDIC